eukprot:TRINITY_DN415_c0_g1_i7.p1 TRINITY_DN415_c0_g1~~TRINITY_DN415_c0_g1_i7.p1  ORF type:complete len:127 (+),score=29.01 TRINITY_DN415_c0_g1_i7:298-678(+)
MGKLFLEYLSGTRVYECISCNSHLADADHIISKSFQGQHGRAFLFENVVNVTPGPLEERALITGMHTVADIHCNQCRTYVGWKYVNRKCLPGSSEMQEEAFEQSQKYKEGKFILEKALLVKQNDWL